MYRLIAIKKANEKWQGKTISRKDIRNAIVVMTYDGPTIMEGAIHLAVSHSRTAEYFCHLSGGRVQAHVGRKVESKRRHILTIFF